MKYPYKVSKFFWTHEVECHGASYQNSCNCGYSHPVNPLLLTKLDEFRVLVNCPVYLSNAFRCRVHNRFVGSGDGSQHPLGLAADIRQVHSYSIEDMVTIAKEVGFDGIGYYDWGIHVDVRNLGGKPDIVFDKRKGASL